VPAGPFLMAAEARLFGTDGVRGVYGEDLTDELAYALGRAAASILTASERRIVIGRDTRASGPALERALAAGITAAGAIPVSAGVIPTAAVAFLVRDAGAAAGAVISASHNPARDNGIKFFGPDGVKLSDEVEAAIEEAMTGAPEAAGDDGVEDMATLEDADDRYLRFLLRGQPSLEGLRIVVDCANGAASMIAPEVYRAAGADVTVLFADPDGTNINDGCGSTHMEVLRRAVATSGAHAGIAHDGDADRVLAVDSKGAIVDGDQILGICALDAKMLGELRGDAIATTVMANLGFRHAMADAGIGIVETAVGDRNVLEAMRKNGLILGGEQSGHVVFLDMHTTGDGILTALRLLAAVVVSGRSLGELAADVPRFPQVLRNVAVADRGALDGAERVWDVVREVEDELGADGRVLVRASGTEPVVRVMVEAATDERAATAADRISEAVSVVLGE